LGVVEYPNNDGFASGLLQSTTPVERDRFVSHLYQSRREYRRACKTAGKSGKQIERCAISTFRIAESVGFKGDFANGSTCCGSAIEKLLLARLWTVFLFLS
jgi:hypothetical protein